MTRPTRDVDRGTVEYHLQRAAAILEDGTHYSGFYNTQDRIAARQASAAEARAHIALAQLLHDREVWEASEIVRHGLDKRLTEVRPLPYRGEPPYTVPVQA